MTIQRRAEVVLPQILGDLARSPYPEYIDDVLATTARARQRPVWMSPQRWIPMVDIARAPVLSPRLQWRVLAIGLLLVALLIAGLALLAGSQRPLPAPFGPARNGVMAFGSGGDVFVADPVTGQTRAIVSGPEADAGPRFSLDGSRLAFERQLSDGRSQIYVADSEGRDIKLLTLQPISLQAGAFGRGWEKYSFSPDGTSLLIATVTDSTPTITIAQVDGSGIRTFDVGMPASEPSFRPPLGGEVLFIGNGDVRGLYAVDVASGTVREILPIPRFMDLAGASWSPDGERLSYWSWGGQGDGEGMTAKSHVVNADETGDIELPMPADAVWNAHATWSNDGTQLFIARGHTPGNEDVRGVVLPADGSSVGIEIAPAGSVETTCCAAWMWSPDDSQLLGRSAGGLGPQQLVVIDVATRTVQTVPWSSTSHPTWQRLGR